MFQLRKKLLVIAVAAFAAGTSVAALQEPPQLTGRITADQRIQWLILSPRNSAGEATGKPLFVQVAADGAFEDPRISAGLYFVSTQPPCVKITDLTVKGNSLLSLATLPPPAEQQADPGVSERVVTQSRAPWMALVLGDKSVQTKTNEHSFQNSTTADLHVGALRFGLLNAGGSSSAKFTAGGIRMVSKLCGSESVKDDANTIRVSGDPAPSKPE